MARRREVGCCFVSTITNGSWSLQRDQYAPVRQAWLKGAVFVDTFGIHGDAITIKLSNVDSVSDCSPEVLLASVEETRADASDDSLASGAV